MRYSNRNYADEIKEIISSILKSNNIQIHITDSNLICNEKICYNADLSIILYYNYGGDRETFTDWIYRLAHDILRDSKNVLIFAYKWNGYDPENDNPEKIFRHCKIIYLDRHFDEPNMNYITSNISDYIKIITSK
jgi:hypothetical protein